MMQLNVICWLTVLFGALVLPAQEKAGEARARKPLLVEPEETSGNGIGAYLGLGDEAAAVEGVWTSTQWQDAVKIADALIEKDREHYGGHALKYLAYLELKGDRMLATQAAVRATKDLAQSPKALGEFINRALYVRPRLNEYQLALMALVPVVPDGRNVASVRVAYLRALVGCGKVKEALATNRDIVKDLAGSREGLLLLAQGICDTKGGKALKDIARQALDQVLKEGESDLRAQMLEHQILYELEEDRKAAHELGVEIIAKGRKTASLNNWLWYLMTRRATAGKYRPLLLQAARQLAAENPTSHELDTIALALYYNGLLDEALDFQERALQASGGGATPGMRRRLEMFRAMKAGRDGQKATKKNGKNESKATKTDKG